MQIVYVLYDSAMQHDEETQEAETFVDDHVNDTYDDATACGSQWEFLYFQQ
jgi:hypothetical protein